MEVTITCTYKTVSGSEALFRSDELDVKKAIIVADDLEKTGRVKRLTFTDERGHEWTIKELRKLTKELQTEPHHLTVYFDGGFDVKAKESGIGIVIYYEQNDQKYRLRKNMSVKELGSNNEAEYAALHFSIKSLEQLGVKHIPVTFIGDSKVVIHQMLEEWPCYEEDFLDWIDHIEADLGRLGITPHYELIPRGKNKEADRLATQALQGIEIIGTTTLDPS